MKLKRTLGTLLAAVLAASSINVVGFGAETAEQAEEQNYESEEAAEIAEETDTEITADPETEETAESEIITAEIEAEAAYDIPILTATATYTTTYEVEGGYIYFDADTGTITDCDTTVTAVTIPDSIDGIAVTSIGDKAFASCKSLTSIDMPDTITSLGSYAFGYCYTLTSIDMPDAITSLGSYAFGYCYTLTSITIPSGVTSIGEFAFEACISLSNVTILSSVTSFGDGVFSGSALKTAGPIGGGYDYEFSWTESIPNYAFDNCDKLTSVELPSSITSIGSYAFSDCSSLTSIDIPDTVTNIGSCAFCECTGLTSITIPGSVTTMGSCAISYCNFETAGPIGGGYDYEFGWTETIPDYAFERCAIASITIPNYIKSIGSYAFSVCRSLTSITIPGSVESIGSYAFTGCSSLTNAVIQDGVQTISAYAFRYCYSLADVTVPESATSIGKYAFFDCPIETAGPIGGGYNFEFGWTETIPNGAFQYFNNLTSVTIPEGITGIGNYAFFNCSNLTSVTIPNSLTDIGTYPFMGCTELTTAGPINGDYNIKYGWSTEFPDNAFGNNYYLTNIIIPNSMTKIGESAFSGCSKLTDIVLPDGITTIGGSAFHNCISLTTINIPDNVTYIGDKAFYGCSELTSITIPSNVTSIGESAFERCTGLTSITIPSNVTSIGESAFERCTGLTSITIPNNVTSIGSDAFYYCTGLTDITIPGSITNISSYSFYGCTGLESAIIKNGVTSIDKYAFANCTGLTSVTIPESVTSIHSYAFYKSTGFSLYCPKGSYAETYAADNSVSYSYIKNSNSSTVFDDEEGSNIYIIGTKSDTIYTNRTFQYYDLRIRVNRDVESADEITVTSLNTSVVDIANCTIEPWSFAEDSQYIWVELDPKKAGTAIISAADTVTGASISYLLTVVDPNTSSVTPSKYNVSESSKINNSEAADFEKIKADISLWESAFYSYEDDIVDIAETARDSADEDDEIYAELVKTLQTNIALDATFTDEETNAAYRAIYETLIKETYNKGVELGKISVSGDFISDSTKIVNNIIENYIGDTLTYDYDKYRVTIHITGIWGANMGSVYVKQRNGSSSQKIAMFSTNSDKMAEIVEDYIDAMKQLANSELSTAIGGFIDYFSSTLGIDQFVKNKTIKALTKMKSTLSAKNLDTFVDLATDVQDIYKTASKVKYANSITSASTVYSAIETLSKKTDNWSASGKAATKAYSVYKKARNKLISDAICYISETPIPESDSLWTKFKKKIGIMCPVNVYVYDSEGNEIGSIVDGQVDCDSDIIGMDVNGDLKEIYVLDESEEITLKYEASDWGLLNLTFEEYSDDGEAMGRMNYYDIPLDKSDEITVTNIGSEPYNIEIDTPSGDLGTYEFIDANDDGGVEITATAENGSVYGSATYVKGDFVQMTATADEGYRFVGWYNGDEFLERNALYEFTASEDISLTAKFIEEICYTTGDINNDGDTDDVDAALLLRYISSITALTDSQISAADCNGDSSVDMLDVIAILQSETESEE